jgi:hypothetical protein
MCNFQAALLLLMCGAAPALAQSGPVIVIPGRPGVPVLINGVDVSYSVIEGELGLGRPGAVTPTVIYRPFVVPVPYEDAADAEPGYFPGTGHRPGYGRLEHVPPPDRALPPPAPTYYRSWSSQSDPGAVTQYPPSPPVVVAPRLRHSRHEDHEGGQRSSQGPDTWQR